MLEGYVLRRRHDVSSLPTMVLDTKICVDLLQLPESAFTLIPRVLRKGRPQVDAALQAPFPSRPRSSGLLHRRHLFT